MDRPRADWKEPALLAAIAIVILLGWSTPFVYPLKILAVFFHEMSHGAMALFTGGSIVEIRLVPNEGGLCITRGGNRFLVASAGYLGSLICGGTLLILAARLKRHAGLTAALGALMLLAGLFWIRPIIGFGFFFVMASGIALTAAAYRLPEWANGLILKLVGLTSCLYAPADIASDVLFRPSLRSDATQLQEITGIPSVIWGVFWVLLSLVLAWFFLKRAWGPTET